MKRISMLILIILSSCANATAGQNDKLELQGPFILPRYPERAVHAWMFGFFGLNVTVSQGAVDTIKLLGRQTLLPIGSRRTPPTEKFTTREAVPEFRKAIEEALRSWKFRNKQSGSFNIEVVFMLTDSSQEKDKIEYTSYRIEELPNGPPTKIIVDAHRLLEETTK